MMQGSLNLTNYSKTIYGKTILLLGLVVLAKDFIYRTLSTMSTYSFTGVSLVSREGSLQRIGFPVTYVFLQVNIIVPSLLCSRGLRLCSGRELVER